MSYIGGLSMAHRPFGPPARKPHPSCRSTPLAYSGKGPGDPSPHLLPSFKLWAENLAFYDELEACGCPQRPRFLIIIFGQATKYTSRGACPGHSPRAPTSLEGLSSGELSPVSWRRPVCQLTNLGLSGCRWCFLSLVSWTGNKLIERSIG